ncbi:MAG: nitronate monooxygenase family protein [Candidatus Omnitrophica bacterium]|nr:nitronate monooxygenase family protein [Candidatus Omnitrophota bacterium]
MSKPLPELKIKNFTSRFPVIQAGMGVRVGIGKLAGAVINAGGMGVIASVGLGNYAHADGRSYVEESNHQLINELRAARSISGGKGPLGINVMVALTNYESLVRTAVQEGIEFIISGAGLPLRLPAYVDEKTALIPIVSSGRALHLIMKTWKRKYNKRPDAVLIEGPLCGGHLGFSFEQLKHPERCSIDILFKEVQDVLGEEGKDIPVIEAEGVNTREDIERCITMGFAGVQIGTRFICVDESGMEPSGQEMYLKATRDDVVIIQSPVGLPARVLKSPLIERIQRGEREKFNCPYRCLVTCDKKTVPYCIAEALLSARAGDKEHGLFMTGANVEPIKSVISVAEFFETLK